MRFFKITLSVIALLVVICLLAAVCLVWFVDPNKLKPVLIEEARQAGYILTMDGNMTWSFYPRLGVQIGHMTVQAEGQPAPFLDVTDLDMAADLAQLWHGQQKLQGDIYIAQARLARLNTQHVSASLRWQNQVLTLDEIKANLYGGVLVAVMHGSEFPAQAKWDWDAKLEQVQIQPLLKDLIPDSKIIVTGTGGVLFKGSTQGKERVQIFNNLNGAVAFSLNNGVVEGMDLNYVVRTVDALLNKGTLPEAEGAVRETAFNSATGTAEIKAGIAQSNDILLLSPAFITKSQGTVNLLTKEIKFALQVTPQQDLRTQWQIPLDITGSLDRPDVSLDKEEIAKFLARQELNKLKEKANDFLQNLLHKPS